MYVVYNKETTVFLTHNSQYANMRSTADRLKTAGAAKALITREVKKGNIDRDDWAIADRTEFFTSIEKTRTVRNLLNPSAGEMEISVNTPRSCDPSSELYHSM